MEEAHDLRELKELISQLGLRDDRHDFQRCKVDILGNFYLEQGSPYGFRDTCQLVDFCRGGVGVKIKNVKFQEGAILHLQFPAGLNMMDVVGKVVHINKEEDGYLVGIQSLSKKADIIKQLFNE